MSFLQQDPRLGQEQNNTDVLQDDAGVAQPAQPAGEAQNAPSQPSQGMAGQGASDAPKVTTAGKNAPRSGMFTNIKSYIDKNKAASQKMAESVGQAIEKKQDVAKQNLQNVQSRYGANVEQGSLQGRDTAIGEVQSRALQAAGKDPNEYGKEQALQQEFGDRYGQYQEELKTQAQQREQDQNTLYEEESKGFDLRNAPAPLTLESEDSRDYAQHGFWGRMREANRAWERNRQKEKEFAAQSKEADAYNRTQHERQATYNELKNKQYETEEETLRRIISGETTPEQRRKTQPKMTNHGPDSIGRATGTGIDKEASRADREAKAAALEQEQQDSQGRLSRLDEILGASYDPVEAADDARFKDIIDAKYKGPFNLFETQGYGDAANKVDRAKAIRQLSESPEDYQQLLDQTLGLPGRDYSAGQKQLDELLFGRKDAQQTFKEKTEGLGDIGQYFEQQKGQARQLGTGREQEIDELRTGARSSFQDVAGMRDTEVDDRLSKVVDNWDDLSEQFRQVFRDGAKSGNLNMSDIEARTLGLEGGEQIFDMSKFTTPEDLIKTTEAHKDRLVGKDEQSQLAELQRLAQLSGQYGMEGSGIDYKNKYFDEGIAGTQSAFDAMDSSALKQALQDSLKRGQGYLNKGYSETGRGEDKYKRVGRSSGKITSYDTRSATMKDILDKDYVGDVLGRKAEDINATQDMSALKNIGKFFQDQESGPNQIASQADLDQTDTSGRANMLGPVYRGADADPMEMATQLALGNPAGAFGELFGLQDVTKYLGPTGAVTAGTELAGKALKGIGLTDVGNFFGGISDSFGGYFGGGYKARAKANAARFAREDAIRKLNATLQSKVKEQDIGKRVGISQDAGTQQRTSDLMRLISQMDKTNL